MLKHFAVTSAFKLGVSIAKMTDVEDVRALLRRMYPVATEHELVRTGCSGDGGYLIPDDLDGIAACFSPGVDNRATFEEALMAQGMRCHLADASVDTNPIKDQANSSFLKKYVGVVNNDSLTTLDAWIDDLEPGDDDLLLQMDIEGAEWQVLLNVSERNLSRFRIVVIELHDMERLMDKHAFQIINSAFERLLDSFYVVHNHPNNHGGVVTAGHIPIPRALEVTLLRRDRVTYTEPATRFPHPLDQTNAPGKPDIVLPAAWHG